MIRTISAAVSAASLLTCITAPVLYFQGIVDIDTFQRIFAAASLGWFAAAITWSTRRKSG